jgi:15-cis-phytoene synthase
MTLSVEESFKYCRQVTRSRARNFYYSFVLLGREEYDAMCGVYAFMRYCDDLSDDPIRDGAEARALLDRWRADLDAALGGRFTDHALWPAFCSVVERFRIPTRYFHEMIDGVASDLEPRQFQTFEELYRYCYQVASVAGLSVVHILGFESPDALLLAEKCGIAFQLTNILRDVREDAEQSRVFFPAEDMARFHVSREDLLRGNPSDSIRDLMRFETARARAYYEESTPLVGMVRRKNRRALWALIEIYRRLLEKIERKNFEVFGDRIRLSAAEKCRVVARAAVGGY